ncbi:MAG: Endonuclease/exonuclease/phosphatase [candidate division WS6 bacterium GW2011_GWC2_36_7]|uniref:Endonuclease/exonuclease/phosphatase n=2 Tax=Candidatus Dojkabacteria TaxID=74243 RepID=A0A0G0HGK2_9BACT|nr:MAG: Endonuclease/exonuclease/phosphatase [candidate division WS6 bacterium GW2011_GWC2_36_7]
MKILQTNIWQGRLVKNFIDLVKEVNPDIITLQEVCSCKETEFQTLNLSSFEDIKAEFPNYNEVLAPTYSFRTMDAEIMFENVILSKYPILNSKVVFTNGEFKKDFNTKYDDYNIRNFVHATIDINGSKLNVITHHGHHVEGTKEGNAETLRQMIVLRDYIKQLSEPVILTGDFNLSPKCESLEILNAELNNLCILSNVETTRNEFAKKAIQVCDYIFTNDLVKVNTFEVEKMLVSDHQALLLDFEI